MWMRPVRRGALLGLLPLTLAFAAVPPRDWVPMRWNWSDPKSLELLSGSPVNCLLLKSWTPELAEAAAARGAVTLAVITPGADAAAEAARAAASKLNGIVLEGDFPDGIAAKLQSAMAGAVIELPSRNRMRLGTDAPVIGTYQGVWPGIQVQDNGAVKAGPSGSAWVDTNTGFIRAVRAWGDTPLWIANQPPPSTVLTGDRYLQVIADAAISGARWVIALDDELRGRLAKREPAALNDWKRMGQLLSYFEQHPEWRGMRSYGKLAIVQDPAKGGLLSGGILDMIAAKHTPVRPIPRERLTPESLAGTTMAVNVDADALTPEQREVLRGFTRGGGTLLTGPPGWKDEGAEGNNITLEKKELDRLNDIWHDVNSMVGRKNLGVRLFNVSSMLSNLLATPDGKQVVVHLVNYSGYPIENVTVHFLGNYGKATLLTPEGTQKSLEIYPAEDGSGVDLDKVGVCATVILN